MAFDNVRFPSAIARGATGGPERRTDLVMTASGNEERNARWANSRRRYNVGYGIKSLNDIHAVVAFFEERRGRLHAFRFKDHSDFKSCAPQDMPSASDQVIGTGTGNLAAFQLTKKYGSGLRDYVRNVSAPVSGTVLVAVNGAPTTQFTLAATTGIVTFNPGSIPPGGATVTAGYEYDVPVRFDTDAISINLEGFTGGDIPDIPLLEVRP
jgi:uncharacterized protein (TIGR02217 family)